MALYKFCIVLYLSFWLITVLNLLIINVSSDTRLHSMWSRVYETVEQSICLSVCPIGRQQQRHMVGLLSLVNPVGRRCWSAADADCYIDSQGTRLNTETCWTVVRGGVCCWRSAEAEKTLPGHAADEPAEEGHQRPAEWTIHGHHEECMNISSLSLGLFVRM